MKTIFRRAAAPALIAAACAAAYSNGLRGPFVFDDREAIVENQTITDLWRLGDVLRGPHGGTTAGGRPVLNLSLAICYAAGGLDVFHYHLMNVAIHILAALALLGIFRRTFELPRVRGFFGDSARTFALLAALLWTLHPLHTQAVTYIIQRAESLAGLFCLLAIYCLIRSADAQAARSAGASSDWENGGEAPDVIVERGLSGAAAASYGSDRPAVSGGAGAGSGGYGAGDGGIPCGSSPTGTAGHDRRAPGPDVATSRRAWQAAAVAACFAAVGTKEIAAAVPILALLYDRAFLAGSFREALRLRRYMYAGMA
ncbi:MAG: hypothetical protein N3A38_14245, partial [Planctomycetota bacterium]|nr:hypothetical protein [Planctomycetota bacterium]